MSCVQLSEGGFAGGLPPWLVVPVIRRCQIPIWIWLVNYLHLQVGASLVHSLEPSPSPSPRLVYSLLPVVSPVLLSRLCNSCLNFPARPVFRSSPLD